MWVYCVVYIVFVLLFCVPRAAPLVCTVAAVLSKVYPADLCFGTGRHGLIRPSCVE